MKKKTADKKSTEKLTDQASPCLVQTVAQAFVEEPALEAVKINHTTPSISVATLGKPDSTEIERNVTSRIERIQEENAEHQCALLDGTADCSTCATQLPLDINRSITIERDKDATTIARVTCPTAPKFWRWTDLPWPRLVPREVLLPDEEDHELEWKLQSLAAGVCGASGLAGALINDETLKITFYLVAYLAGCWFTVHEVCERLKKGAVDVHFLMLAVALGSASIGAWGEGAMLLFLFSLSGALEHYAMGRTSREIRSLFKSAPKEATVLEPNGDERRVAVDRLEPGMRLLVRPDEQFPVDAELVKGATASDESNLTGEAIPVEKRIGDTLLAGTLNLWGAVEVIVVRRASQSALQRIIRLIKEAQHLKAPSQRFTDHFGTTYTYGIIGLTLFMFFLWWLGFGNEPFQSTGTDRSAFYKAMTLLVVASPCALVLSIPSAVLAAIAYGARRGILFRGGAAVENLAEISVVAMDKTGTLTTGELQVARVESFPPGREQEVATLAYSLEKLSAHPLARAITAYGKRQQLASIDPGHITSVAGAGLEAQINGEKVRLGKHAWVAELHPTTPPPPQSAADPGLSEVWLTSPNLVGRVLLRDDLRPQTRSVVANLRELGLKTIVLTGDRKATGETLKSRIDVDEVRAELKPEQKVDIIRSLVAENQRVAMIGDGVNDAPSLAVADVGVAMGARGSDAALEQAEVVLMHDRLERFLTAFRLSQRAKIIIRQNLVISLGTVVLLVASALLGAIPLTLGVLGHEGSTVIVVMNSLRLLLGRSNSTA